MSIKTFRHEDGTYTASENDWWYPGIYDSEGTAAIVIMNMTREEVDREFSHIYTVDGQERSITTADFVQYHGRKLLKEEQEREKTAEEKLAKIEELMHPGFWGAFDYRREAILKALGSERSSWSKEPEEYAGH